jgi:GntR family transcriptional regulator
MYLIEVDRTGPVPLHDQAATDIRRATADGDAPGDRLPPVKDIAAVLRVNKNSVLGAMHILRDEGLLEFRRGRGPSVVGTPQQSEILRRVKELVDRSRHNGYRTDELIEMIESDSSSNSRAIGEVA